MAASSLRDITQRDDPAPPLLPFTAEAAEVSTITVTNTAPSVLLTTTVAATQVSSVETTVISTSTLNTITQQNIIAIETSTQVVITTAQVEATVITQPMADRTGQLSAEPPVAQPSLGYFVSQLDPQMNDDVGILCMQYLPFPPDTIALVFSNPPSGTLVASVIAPIAEGNTIYYDPIYADFGPLGGNGLLSYIAAVPPDDSRASTTSTIKCTVDLTDHLQCAWGLAGNGDFWICNERLTIVQAGYNPLAFCTDGDSRKIDVKWTDVVP